MMHAVGFFHEQSRPDRDSYVQIMWQNIQPGMQGQFEKYSPATVQTFDTQYDYQSILHYDGVAFSRNGLPTIVPKVNTRIGQRGGFSGTDSFKINKLYECTPPSASTVQTTVQTTTTPSPVSQTTVATYRKLPTVHPGKCVNKRPDCDQLFKDGWCAKNENYMNEQCCGICNRTDTLGQCEDLRVDCLHLVKKRYCIISPKFSKEYCSKSCGFCAPNDKDIIPDFGTTRPIIGTLIPQITTTQLPFTTTTPLSTTLQQLLCRDKNFKCVQWKKMGYCNKPMYSSYMKQTCPFSCKYCTVYTQSTQP